jgi:hypothetical protein
MLKIMPSRIKPDKATMEITQRVFSDKNVTIDSEEYIIITTKDGRCAIFCLYPDHIYIDSLSKCGSTSGGDLLTMIYTIAKEMPKNIKYIELVDASQIKICSTKISLRTLKILTTGQSWYNSHGYYSENYDSEKTHNEEIINMNYENFIDIVYKKRLEKFKSENSIEQLRNLLESRKEQLSTISKSDNKDRYQFIEQRILEIQDIIVNHNKFINSYIQKEEEEINEGMRLFPDVNKTVKDYFNYVLSNIKDDKDCQNKETIKKSMWLSNYIPKIEYSPILQYESKLRKMVIREESGKGGSKSKKSKFKKSKSKRSKSKKSKSKKSKSKRSKKY